jgi:hypothetical protein
MMSSSIRVNMSTDKRIPSLGGLPPRAAVMARVVVSA